MHQIVVAPHPTGFESLCSLQILSVASPLCRALLWGCQTKKKRSPQSQHFTNGHITLKESKVETTSSKEERSTPPTEEEEVDWAE